MFSVYDQAPGADDETILQRAVSEDRILITCDKDFGELVFRDNLPHRGIILLRVANQEPANLIAALDRLLHGYADQMAGRFTVVTEAGVRMV